MCLYLSTQSLLPSNTMHALLGIILVYSCVWQEVWGDSCLKEGPGCEDKKPSDKYTQKINMVQQQFETYPSPEFTEDDMAREVDWYKKFKNDTIENSRAVQHAALEQINHFLFGGKSSFHAGFRVLVVGGGTGYSLLYLAEQLRNTDAQVWQKLLETCRRPSLYFLDCIS